jgi:hypothetical protein
VSAFCPHGYGARIRYQCTACQTAHEAKVDAALRPVMRAIANGPTAQNAKAQGNALGTPDQTRSANGAGAPGQSVFEDFCDTHITLIDRCGRRWAVWSHDTLLAMGEQLFPTLIEARVQWLALQAGNHEANLGTLTALQTSRPS